MLRRCTCQRGTLREFYEKRNRCQFRAPAQMMLTLLPLLEADLGDREVWGLTSHLALHLKSVDDWQAESGATIAPTRDGFKVGHKKATGEWVWFGTASPEEACRIALAEMVDSTSDGMSRSDLRGGIDVASS